MVSTISRVKNWDVIPIPEKGGNRMVIANQQTSEQITPETEVIEDLVGTVLLKNGNSVRVRLDDLKQFLRDNHDQVVSQKRTGMGKRRVEPQQ